MSQGRIEPDPQVPIGQQVEAEQGREVREIPRPGEVKMGRGQMKGSRLVI